MDLMVISFIGMTSDLRRSHFIAEIMELEDAIRTSWNNLESHFINKIMFSMDKRYFEIIEKNGNIISY